MGKPRVRFMAVLSIFPTTPEKTSQPASFSHLSHPHFCGQLILRPLDPEGPLAKTIISAEPGALMKVAEDQRHQILQVAQ